MKCLRSLKKYRNGKFSFKNGDKLRTVSKNVPDESGVYFFKLISKDSKKIIYIGCSGKMKNSGEFGSQKLHGRINNKQDSNTTRVRFFNKLVNDNDVIRIDVYWFVTFDEEYKDIPAYVEALLIQKYFEKNGHLPQWNKEL